MPSPFVHNAGNMEICKPHCILTQHTDDAPTFKSHICHYYRLSIQLLSHEPKNANFDYSAGRSYQIPKICLVLIWIRFVAEAKICQIIEKAIQVSAKGIWFVRNYFFACQLCGYNVNENHYISTAPVSLIHSLPILKRLRSQNFSCHFYVTEHIW